MSASRHARLYSDIVLTAAVIGLLVGACSKPQPVGGGAAVTAGRWLDGYPGQDPAKTKDYFTNTIKFGSKSPQDSAFSGNYPCTGCTQDSVKLTVVPEKKAQEINWDEAMRNGKKGSIVAKIVNDNAVPYPALQLQAHDSAYMWVGPINNAGQSAVAYYKFDFSTGALTGPMAPTQAITYCDMPNWQSRTHSAAKGENPHDAGNCHASSYAPLAATNTALNPLPLFTNVSFTRAMFVASGGTWISCVYGCCEVGYPQ